MSQQYKVVEVSMAQDSVLPADLKVGSSISKAKLEKEYVGLSGAQAKMGVAHQQYVRRLTSQGKLEGIKVDMGHYVKWWVSLKSIEAYMENNRRTEQARRYVLRIELEDEVKVRKALKDAGVDFSLELAYKGKDK